MHNISSLQASGLCQHVTEPTHIKGHILDIVVSKHTGTSISSVHVLDPCLCDRDGNITGDHLSVTFTTSIAKSAPVSKKAAYRKLKAINMDAFKQDFTSRLPSPDHDISAEQHIFVYNNCLHEAIDLHVSQIHSTMTLHPNTLLYTSELR